MKEEERIRSNDCLGVTEICSCLRKSYFDRKCKKQYTDASLIHITMGKGLHLMFEEVFERMGCETEVSIRFPLRVNDEEVLISGRADAVGDNYIIELKSCSKDLEEPYSSHVMQLNAYLYMFKVKKGYLIYINKSNGRIHVFEISFSPELWREFVERAKKLYLALKNNTVPGTEWNGLCMTCPYKSKCFKDKRQKDNSNAPITSFFNN